VLQKLKREKEETIYIIKDRSKRTT